MMGGELAPEWVAETIPVTSNGRAGYFWGRACGGRWGREEPGGVGRLRRKRRKRRGGEEEEGRGGEENGWNGRPMDGKSQSRWEKEGMSAGGSADESGEVGRGGNEGEEGGGRVGESGTVEGDEV